MNIVVVEANTDYLMILIEQNINEKRILIEYRNSLSTDKS